MRARTAIVELLKAESEWRQLFKRHSETSPLRLRSQAWQWRDELAGRARDLDISQQSPVLLDVEDTLFDLAHKFFPDSPAARWDPEWASGLCKDSLTRLAEHYAGLSEAECDELDLSGQDAHEEAMLAAGHANDPAAFRLALKGWERVGLEALENARTGKGAA